MAGGDEETDLLDLDQIRETGVEGASWHSKCLVGKLQAEKSVNSYALLEVMKEAWRAKQGLEAREWTHNLFLFRFEDISEMTWVIKNQPWHFEGHLFTIRPLKDKEQPSGIQIKEAQLWVRIYDAPVSCMTATHAKAMARKLGILVDFDSPQDFFGKYIRIKVEMDITKPLKRGLDVVIGGKQLWLPIKYEGLPLFCYNCGMIGHTFKACEALDHTEDQDPQDLPFGPGIKASPLKKIRPWSPRNENTHLSHSTPLARRTPSNTKPISSPTNSLDSSNRTNNPTHKETHCPQSPHKTRPIHSPLWLQSNPMLHSKTSQPTTDLTPNPEPNIKELPSMELDITSTPMPLTIHSTQTKIQTSHSSTTSYPTAKPTSKPKLKKQWKKLARESHSGGNQSPMQICRGKRPVEVDSENYPATLSEAKRLKFLSICTNTDSTAEAAKELPRRSP